MKQFIHRHSDFFSYTFYGFLASAINVVVFHQLVKVMGLHLYLVANICAYIVAMLFTFMTNKLFVFHSAFRPWEHTFHEFTSFCGVRTMSFLLDSLFMIVGIQFFHGQKDFVKIFDQVCVGIVNYFFSKWFIFETTEKITREQRYHRLLHR